jgi:transposase
LFLRVPGAPLDNNICERALKMAIRHRNNSLFYKTLRGAQVGDLYMTLIFTAEAHGVNAYEYLTALLEHASDLAANPSAWLPWTWNCNVTARVPA